MVLYSLDPLISNIVCVFSFQKRISSYTGPCCKIRRSSDNSTNDLYFLSNGNLDYSTLITWIGSSDAFLQTWYNQNPNSSNHLVMNNQGNQPKITSDPGILSLTDKNILKPLYTTSTYLQAASKFTNNKHIFIKQQFTANSDTFILTDTDTYHFHSNPNTNLFTNTWADSQVLNGKLYIDRVQTPILTAPYLSSNNNIRLLDLILSGTSTVWSSIARDRNINRYPNGSIWTEIIIFSTELDLLNRIKLENVMINEICETDGFSNIDLSGVDLSGVDLSSTNLTNAKTGPLINFPSSVPSNQYKQIISNGQKYIFGPDLNLSNLSFASTDISNSNLSGVNFSNSDLSGVNFSNSIFNNSGLKFQIYSGYMGYYNGTSGTTNVDDPTFTSRFTKTDTPGYSSDFTSITTATNGIVPADSSRELYSVEWFGYFRPNVSGTWKFKIGSDDCSYLWLGTNALDGNDTSLNALAASPGLHGMQYSGDNTINLTANTYYPIRIQFGEQNVGDNLNVIVTDPLGTQMSNLYGLVFASNSTIVGSNFSGANLSNCYLALCDLSGCELTNAKTINVIGKPKINPIYKNVGLPQISAIQGKTGDVIDRIILYFTDGTTVEYGGTGGGFTTKYNLDEDEYVYKIDHYGTSNTLQGVYIKFYTNKQTIVIKGLNSYGAVTTYTVPSKCILTGINWSGSTISSLITSFQINNIIGPYLNLENIDLSGYDISNTNLTGSNLSNGNLSNCDLSGANLINTKFIGSKCILTNLSYTDFSGCDLSGTDLSGSNINNTKTGPFSGIPMLLPSNYYKVIQKSNQINYIVGPQLNLSAIDLSNTDLSGINLTGTNLTNTNLSGSNLSGCNLSKSNLTNTNFSFADLSGTDLSGVNLVGTNLSNIYNQPIHIDSNWIFDQNTKSIIPVITSSNTIREILYNQIQNSQSSDTIVVYKNSDTVINQTAKLIKPQTNGSIYWSTPSTDIQIKINDVSKSDISNIIINVVKQTDISYSLPTINGSQTLFLLYFKALDSSANSIITPLKPIIMDISLNTNSNFVLLYKYAGTVFDPTNYIIGTKLKSGLVTNSYRFIFTSNSNYGATTTNTLNILTGGDPHIRPLLGPQYILPNEIKFVCLLNDPTINLQINARVGMMKKSDFPNPIFARDSWCDSRKLGYLYNYSYYRELYVSIDSEHILINTDTLEIKNSSCSNQFIKYFTPKPKKGMYSLIHGIEYPIFDTTKIIKIFVDKYIITLTSDLTTDERHFINLEYYGTNNISACNGAFISQTKTFVMDDITGTNSDYYYKDFKAYLQKLQEQRINH